MARTNTIGKTATAVFTDRNGMTNVVYHNTTVVSFNNDKIILDNGGYLTVTTKLRMNQTANQFNLGYCVFQKNHEWFVDFNNQVVPFESGMALNRR